MLLTPPWCQAARRLAIATCIVLTACGKTSAPSDAAGPPGAPTAVPPPSASVAPRDPPLPICEPWLVPAEIPKDWKTYPIVATSDAPVLIETRNSDHYVDEHVDVPVGPFMLRYWHGQTRPAADDLELRFASCQGMPLSLPGPGQRFWTGGSLVLRMKDGLFVFSSGGSFEHVIAVVRRLPK